MWDKNLLPSPSPLLAPRTSPAISTNSTVAGEIVSGLKIFAILFKRLSGISTIPTFGSIVQKGWFSYGTVDFVSALKIVDLPTLGKPIIPAFNPIIKITEISFIFYFTLFKKLFMGITLRWWK